MQRRGRVARWLEVEMAARRLVVRWNGRARIAGTVIPGCQGRSLLGYLALDYGVRSLGPSSPSRFSPLP